MDLTFGLGAGVLISGIIFYLGWLLCRGRPSGLQHSSASSWRELLHAVLTGGCIGSALFRGILLTYLSPPVRPVVPDIALGYTYSFNVNHGSVFGTYFEYLVIAYGLWPMWGVLILFVLFRMPFRIVTKSYVYPLIAIMASAICMMLGYAIWLASLSAARS